jgi:hypothetical protein|tara:strand:- start:1063 stop:1371 length:309 start_codon:yes stop_codon:yes gene_type:complete
MAEHKAKVNPQYERALKLLKNKDKMSNKAYANEFFAILKMGVRPTRKGPSRRAKGGVIKASIGTAALKKPTADQVGLKKLPTPVRNKMGYMNKGGAAKKKKR